MKSKGNNITINFNCLYNYEKENMNWSSDSKTICLTSTYLVIKLIIKKKT